MSYPEPRYRGEKGEISAKFGEIDDVFSFAK